ncbi:MAG TPA: tRNA pseudouridine(55) synthase TruB, partial [Stellaceae bacterium]|nr:tRNA pseudouridine(55) synthase TruB [Stellaceae bacterium]
PRFTGRIWQRPPAFSALKIAGERAYDLARAGKDVTLAPREVEIKALRLLAMPDRDRAQFEAVVGKGTYIRSLARDIGETLGTVAYVTALRRLEVGRFTLAHAISLAKLAELGHSAGDSSHLLPIETALDDIPALALTEAEAHRLRCGQALALTAVPKGTRREELGPGVIVCALCGGKLVALVEVVDETIRPIRVMNL